MSSESPQPSYEELLCEVEQLRSELAAAGAGAKALVPWVRAVNTMKWTTNATFAKEYLF
ncbi:MAG: hypothetical protein GY822_32530 [Deltaproteobacteria bacterium]|nr:hypothetical protein [Deltaproteobacteria bacterium]